MTRRRGFTVALVGADGAGKTTLATRLAADLPMPTVSAYMGDGSGVHAPGARLLPTTRWLLRHWSQAGHAPESPELPSRASSTGAGSRAARRYATAARRAIRPLGRFATTLNTIAEEYHQQWRVQRLVRAGWVVVLDRHYYYDYYFHHIAVPPRRLADQLHGIWLSRVLRRPDLTLALDAPVEVLYERKPEGTLAERRVRREEYLRLAAEGQLRLVDASRPADQVAADLAREVLAWRGERRSS